MGAEAAAPMVAKFLFGDKPISELSADEKATVSSITSLGGLGVGASTGDVGSAVSAGEAAKVATQDNGVEVAAPVCGPLVEVCFVGGVAITAATVYANTPEGKKKIEEASSVLGKGWNSTKETVGQAYGSVKNAIFNSGPNTGNSDLDEVLENATPSDSGDKGYEYPGTQQDLVDKIGNIE